ncbi:MAG: sugar ABC transporter ATP-binding protein [Clostridiales bacterium]|nr:sugar ABC transporter ATP-binding protein [Clostridiales bacterium]
MIQLLDISKTYGAVQALKQAHMTVAPGRITALLGSNGSGKSTLIKILAGLVSPNTGQVLLDGQEVFIRSGNDAKALGIATAFQDLSLVPMMTVEENLLLGDEPTRLAGMLDQGSIRQTVASLLERFSLKCQPQDFVQTLPPSTQYMLEIAKAVHRRPRVLLLDEATAALHQDEIDVLFKILRQLRNEGVAIVFVTHRMHEVFELCDEAVILRSGETVKSGPVSDFSLDDLVYYMTGQRMQEAAAYEGLTHKAGQAPLLTARAISLPPRVKDITLEAYAGEIVGIGGLEGQGQSDFMRALLGASQIFSGQIHFDVAKAQFKQPADAIKAGIGFISGERNREAMFADRTIAENIFAGNTAKGRRFTFLKKSAVNRFANQAVDTYQIKVGRIQDAASTLSGGNQQKLVIARWIAMQPKLLLLDDPTKGVDIHSRLEIHQILRQCADDGMAVIISASDTDELMDIADRIYVFYEGMVSGMLEGENKTHEHLVACMMGVCHIQPERQEGGA